ncbi:hypothetical protein LP419_34100 [Massilia sp. H-1]|nr:hypothetical protein LP419_34100 [Massilia sp. H-1]
MLVLTGKPLPSHQIPRQPERPVQAAQPRTAHRGVRHCRVRQCDLAPAAPGRPRRPAGTARADDPEATPAERAKAVASAYAKADVAAATGVSDLSEAA